MFIQHNDSNLAFRFDVHLSDQQHYESLALPSNELGDHNALFAYCLKHGAGDIQLVVLVLVGAPVSPEELHASRQHLLPLGLKTLMVDQVQSLSLYLPFINLEADPGL